MKSSTPIITAVICTRNRERFIGACIESLLRQHTELSLFEILVVNNGSTDGTSAILESYAERGAIRVVNEPVAGLSRARNTGWQMARGEYVGYIDDDAVTEPTWIESVLQVFQKVYPSPSWVGGPIQLTWETARPEWVDDDLAVPLGYLHWGDTPRRLTNQERLGGGNSIFPRAVLQKLDGFDERLGRGASGLLSGEETQLQYRIEQAGGSLHYHPGICIHHFVSRERTEAKWFYKRYFWGGVTDYVMSRTLNGTPALANEDTVASVKSGHYDIVLRLSTNVALSLGLGMSSCRTIRARIYMAYVIGRLYGVFHWKRANGWL